MAQEAERGDRDQKLETERRAYAERMGELEVKRDTLEVRGLEQLGDCNVEFGNWWLRFCVPSATEWLSMDRSVFIGVERR